MRTLLAVSVASFVLIGCGSLGSSAGSSGSSSGSSSTGPEVCPTIVTKTGVVEQC